jgi:hypothetical protein
LPEKYAILENVVKLKNHDTGEWSEGWKIVSVGPSTEHPPDYRKMIRSHRDNTGDGLPKRENKKRDK